MKIEAKTDFASFEKAIAHVPTDAKRQFAIGLSRIAKTGKEAARDNFDKNYIARGTFMSGSIISTGATVNRLSSSVGTINHLMSLHLFGGTSGGDVAVKGLRWDDKRDRVPRSMTAAKLESKLDSGKSTPFFKKTDNSFVSGASLQPLTLRMAKKRYIDPNICVQSFHTRSPKFRRYSLEPIKFSNWLFSIRVTLGLIDTISIRPCLIAFRNVGKEH